MLLTLSKTNKQKKVFCAKSILFQNQIFSYKIGFLSDSFSEFIMEGANPNRCKTRAELMNEYRKKADAYINGLISEINANSAELFRLDPQTNGITSDENSIYYKLDHPEAANIQADDAQTPSDGSQPNDK